MRLASIDLGTNTLILTLVDKKAGKLIPIKEDVRIVRLGQALKLGGPLHFDAKERCLAVLHNFSRQINELNVDEILAVGTAALRNAADGQEFADEIQTRFAIPLKIISGHEEAKLTFKVIQHEFYRLSQSFFMIDIGGGSTELVVGNKHNIDTRVSLEAGTVLFSERFVKHDPPTSQELLSASKALMKMLHRTPKIPLESVVVGVAGTVTTLKAVELQMDKYDHSSIHGAALTRNEITRLGHLCNTMSSVERAKLKGLPPERADIIPMGITILDTILTQLKQESIIISDRGLRWGLIYDWLEKNC